VRGAALSRTRFLPRIVPRCTRIAQNLPLCCTFSAFSLRRLATDERRYRRRAACDGVMAAGGGHQWRKRQYLAAKLSTKLVMANEINNGEKQSEISATTGMALAARRESVSKKGGVKAASEGINNRNRLNRMSNSK